MKYISIIITLFLLTSSFAEVIHVPGNQPTIQAGINTAVTGDTVLVTDSTYYENINFKGKAITVASYFLIDNDSTHIDSTIIDGSQPSHPDSGSVVYFISGEDTTSILCGFTITGGTGTSFPQYGARVGGGIVCSFSGGRFTSNKIIYNTLDDNSLFVFGGGFGAGPEGSTSHVILEKNKILNNEVTCTGNLAYGGGVAIACNGKLIDNVISHNSCTSTTSTALGGGVRIAAESIANPRTVTIKGNRITYNYVSGRQGSGVAGARGGGISNHYCKVIILENEILYNRLSGIVPEDAWGAGIFMGQSHSESLISRNKICYNTIPDSIIGKGGGIIISVYGLPITNNIISQNTAVHGGGIYLNSGTGNCSPEIINNTIVSNTSFSSGGGLYADAQSNPVIVNNIFWANGAPTSAQISGDVTVDYSNIQGGWTGLGSYNINTDPQLMDTLFTSDDTLFCCLPTGSPCIDMGNPVPAYDDPEDPNNPGYALWPAMGTIRNDMGAYGGPGAAGWIIMGIEDEFKLTEEIPSSFLLYQNYPNPFNPTTTIEFELLKSNEVTLNVFNILGEEVATLVSERLSAGSYSYEWDASNLASGVYLYRLETEGYVKTRKMILMK